MDMAKLKRRKRKKMTITQRYNRIDVGLQYFGISLNEKKRASRKALKEAQKIYRKAREEAKAGGMTDLPSIAQLEKYVRESQPEVDIPPIDEKEELPYADINDIPEFNEYEAIINQFIDTMQEALSESVKIYGMSQPWLARTFENAILGVMAKFNEARAKLGDAQLAQNIADSLDYEQIITLIAYDYNEALDMLDNMASVFDSMITDWNT